MKKYIHQRPRLSLATLALAAGMSLAVTGPVQAQFVEEVGASQRIDLSGKLRMLSERIPALACNRQAGILPETTGPLLEQSITEFDMIIQALKFGNEDLGIIGAEERRKTIAAIDVVLDHWTSLHDKADDIAATGGNIDEVIILAQNAEPMLAEAQLLVSEISGQYADPTELLQSDALVIDFAGRQRMLAQKMSKDVCLIETGVEVEASMAELATTSQMFDTTLNALRNGMPEAGIAAATDPEIVAGLDTVHKDWIELQPAVERTLAGEVLNTEERSLILTNFDQMTADMNAVVNLYSAASKLGL